MAQEVKHAAISDEIRTAILSGVYKDRLPTVRELAKNFETSGRTIHKALKPLSDSGLIMANGIHGVTINAPGRRRPDSGVIGVYSRGGLLVPDDPLLIALNQVISAHGKKILFLSSLDDGILHDIALWNNSHMQGFIFIYSSFDAEVARLFRSHHIPYVVGNRIYGKEPGNWVDFDSDQLFEKIVSTLHTEGIRKIAMMWPSVIPEVQNGILQFWKNKVEKYGIQSYDHFLPDRAKPNKPIEYAEYLYSHKDRPEAVVCWGHYAEKLATFCAERQWFPLIISQEQSTRPNVLTIELSYRELAENIWRMMEELLSGKPVTGINKLIPFKIDIKSQIDQYIEWIKQGGK